MGRKRNLVITNLVIVYFFFIMDSASDSSNTQTEAGFSLVYTRLVTITTPANVGVSDGIAIVDCNICCDDCLKRLAHACGYSQAILWFILCFRLLQLNNYFKWKRVTSPINQTIVAVFVVNRIHSFTRPA